MFLIAIRPLHDKFGGSMSMDGKIQLILNLCKKYFGGRSIPIVIDAGSVNVGDFLVKSALAASGVGPR